MLHSLKTLPRRYRFLGSGNISGVGQRRETGADGENGPLKGGISKLTVNTNPNFRFCLPPATEWSPSNILPSLFRLPNQENISHPCSLHFFPCRKSSLCQALGEIPYPIQLWRKPPLALSSGVQPLSLYPLRDLSAWLLERSLRDPSHHLGVKKSRRLDPDRLFP